MNLEFCLGQVCDIPCKLLSGVLYDVLTILHYHHTLCCTTILFYPQHIWLCYLSSFLLPILYLVIGRQLHMYMLEVHSLQLHSKNVHITYETVVHSHYSIYGNCRIN